MGNASCTSLTPKDVLLFIDTTLFSVCVLFASERKRAFRRKYPVLLLWDFGIECYFQKCVLL